MRSFSCSTYHVAVVLLLAATAAGVETTTSDEVTPSLQFDEVAFASAHSAKSIHLTDTQNSIQESTFKNDVSPLPATALVQSSKKTSKNKQVLENIKSLYAYAGLAWEKAEDKDNLEQPKKQAPVLALLKHLARKTKTKNLVVRFADVFATVRNEFAFRGVGAYVLRNIHNAVLHGKGAVHVTFNADTEHYEAGFNHKALGLTSKPRYIKQLNVVLHKYTTAKHHISTKGMLKSAALACFTAGKLRHYKSFYRDVLINFATEKRRVHSKLARSALKGVKGIKIHSLVQQNHGGIKGAKAALRKMGGAVLIPTGKALKREAKRLASKWAEKHGGCGSAAQLASHRVVRLNQLNGL